jgi:hypothetical protein
MADGEPMNRRTAIASLGAAVSACAHKPDGPRDAVTTGEALYRTVEAYAALGVHRTGSTGDHATTLWLERRLTTIGLRPERQPWDTEVFEVDRACLVLPGDAGVIEGLPLWPPRATPVDGVSASLSVTPRPGAISLITLPYARSGSLEAAGYEAALHAASDGGAVGVLAVTDGPLGELIALNTSATQPRWTVPVLLVAGRERARMTALADSGQPVRMELSAHPHRETVHNVLGRRRGAGPGLVISTPKSGWFQCAGERGAGMAVALALADWAVRTTALDVRFVSATGHEFHGEGGRVLLASGAPAPGAVKLWVHIGANVAVHDWTVADGTPVRLPGAATARGVACHPEILTGVSTAFAGQPGYQTPVAIGAGRVPGETQLYADAGYRPLIGLIGSGPLHHTPADTAVATSPELLAPVAQGLIDAVRASLEAMR